MKIQKPSLGRIVIFTAFRGHTETETDQYAGIIVKVHPDTPETPGGSFVDIVTLGSSSVYHNNRARFDADGLSGTWRYPPHVKEEIEV